MRLLAVAMGLSAWVVTESYHHGKLELALSFRIGQSRETARLTPNRRRLPKEA